MVKDSIVIYRKNETILILMRLKCYFPHPEKSILNLSLPYLQGGIVLPGHVKDNCSDIDNVSHVNV